MKPEHISYIQLTDGIKGCHQWISTGWQKTKTNLKNQIINRFSYSFCKQITFHKSKPQSWNCKTGFARDSSLSFRQQYGITGVFLPTASVKTSLQAHRDILKDTRIEIQKGRKCVDFARKIKQLNPQPFFQIKRNVHNKCVMTSFGEEKFHVQSQCKEKYYNSVTK